MKEQIKSFGATLYSNTLLAVVFAGVFTAGCATPHSSDAIGLGKPIKIGKITHTGSAYPPPPPVIITTTNSIGMKFVWIEAHKDMLVFSNIESTCDMNAEDAIKRAVEKRGIWMGQHEVTQEQFIKIMGYNPSYFEGDCNPVERVSWHEAMEFCKRLSKIESKIYTLPTACLWGWAACEYLIHLPVQEKAIDTFAWNGAADNNGMTTNPVDRTLPNSIGLYDMLGNVIEWCQPGGHCMGISLDYYDEEDMGAFYDGRWMVATKNLRSIVVSTEPEILREKDTNEPLGFKDIPRIEKLMPLGFRVVLLADPAEK